MITDAGLTELLNRAVGLSAGATPYIAVGTSTTAPTASDTAMGTELSRVLATVVSVTNNTLTLRGFMNTAQGNGTLAETGLLTAAASGTLLEHSAISPAQVKTSAQEAIIETVITLTRA